MMKIKIPKINSIHFGGKWQDNSKIPYYERTLKEKIPYDPERQYAVIHVSICTGEKVAGFKNYNDAHFTEVMLIRDAEDEKRFKAIYGLDEIKKEY
ncbi:MAG: aspartate dehydrogenase [Acetatifactor sp.]